MSQFGADPVDLFSRAKAWPVRTFGSLVAGFRYGTSNKSEEFGLPTLRIPNVVGGVLDLTDLKSVPVSAAEETRLRLVDGDLLFVRTNGNSAYVGRCAVFSPEAVSVSGVPPDRFIYASYLIRARLRPHAVVPAFVREFMRSPAGRAQLKANSRTSAGQYNINIEGLSDIQIPLPPVGVQQAIVDVLRQAEVTRRIRQKSSVLLDELSRSLFVELFGDLAANNPRWESAPLGTLSHIASGITKGRRTAELLSTVPYLAVANVQDMRLDLSQVKEIGATTSEIERYRLRHNDLLLTEGGDPDKLGRGTLWREELPLAIHQNHIFRVRVNAGADVDPVFLNWLISSEYGKRYFLQSAKQTTGIASINATQLKSFPVLLPPMGLQRRFSSMLAVRQKCEKAHGRHLTVLDSLFTSLQARSFAGEL